MHLRYTRTGHNRHPFRCIWLLEELEDDEFEICMLRPRDPGGPQMREYGGRQSHKIPTLLVDGEEILDSGVISQVIAERFGRDLALMGTPDERLEVLQWIAMAETCITFRIPHMPTLMNAELSGDDLKTQAIEHMRAVSDAT